MSWLDEIRFDAAGLVPVIAQDSGSGAVLMLAYANREALERTAASGEAHYFSRSRGELWRKGETSGNIQEVRSIHLDCDGDAVLYRVRQTGPACHTGEETCFHRELEEGEANVAPPAVPILGRIEQVVRRREEERPEGSYTTYLFEQGLDKVLKKLGEETTEVVIAAKNGDPAELSAETADLVFHLVVLLRERGLPLSQVWEELERRFGRPASLGTRRGSEHPHS